jgi:hypothetical protein
VQDATVDADTDEALRTKVLHHDRVRDFRREDQRKGDDEAGPFGECEHGVDHRLHGVGLELATTHWAIRSANARPEQAEVVVDLRRCADCRPRRLRRILLLDRYRRRKSVDGIDVRLLHSLEELTRIRREGLHVPTLAFGVDRIEGKR